jgi:hypothetical protein
MILSQYFTIKRILLFLASLFSVILIVSFFRHYINGDEGIIAEHSYWFGKEGIVKSKMFEGMGLGWEIRQYHYHKFFVIIGAAVIKLSGISLYAMRTISFTFLITTVYFIYRYIFKNYDESNLNIFLLTFIVLIANYNFTEYGIIFRPETMLTSLGFISFYLLHKGIETSQTKFYIFSAVFAGLSVFTHLNGVSFVFAGFLLLILNKKIKIALLFGFISSIFASFYFFDILSINELKAFWHQFSKDPNLSNQDTDLFNPLTKLINEQQRFFWNANMSIFTVFTIICLIFNFKILRKEQRNLLFYLLFLITGLALFSHGKTLKYGLIYFPYMALIIGYSLFNFRNFKLYQKLVLIILFSVFLTVGGISIFKDIILCPNAVQRNEMKAEYMPRKNINVLAGENLFFNQAEHYTIHIRLAFSLLYEKYIKKTPTEKDFFDFAEKNKNIYIVADKHEDTEEFIKLIQFDRLKEGDILYNYKVIKKINDFVVFEYIK